MEWKGVWDKWDEARGVDEEVGRSYSWHEEWLKDVKSHGGRKGREEKKLERQTRRAGKEKKDEERKMARQEKKEREERVLEELRKKGYLARYV